MSGPIVPDFDPDFFRELLGERRREEPTHSAAVRSMAVLTADPRLSARHRAWWTLAEYVHAGNDDIDIAPLNPSDRAWIAGLLLILQTIHAPRYEGSAEHEEERRRRYDSLVAALRTGRGSSLVAWITATTVEMRRAGHA